jgi:hypothetical protein
MDEIDASQLTEERPVENSDAQLKAILEAIVYVTDEPLSAQQMAAALEGVTRTLVVEQNHSAQFYRYLRSVFDLPGKTASFHRPGPLPLRPGELAAAIAEWWQG